MTNRYPDVIMKVRRSGPRTISVKMFTLSARDSPPTSQKVTSRVYRVTISSHTLVGVSLYHYTPLLMQSLYKNRMAWPPPSDRSTERYSKLLAMCS